MNISTKQRIYQELTNVFVNERHAPTIVTVDNNAVKLIYRPATTDFVLTTTLGNTYGVIASIQINGTLTSFATNLNESTIVQSFIEAFNYWKIS